MPNTTMRVACCCLGMSFCASSALIAQTTAIPVRQVMVVRPDAKLKAKKTVFGTLSLGDVILVTQEQKGWLWAPVRFGWVRKADTLPLEQALQAFTADIKKKPTATAHHHRGLAWGALGKHQEAIADFTTAIHLKPNDASLYNNRGNSWRHIGSLKNALKDYETVLKIDPENAPAFNNRGLVRLDQGNQKRALRDFQQAIKANPKFADAYNNRGVTYRDLGKLKSALADYNRALQLNPRLTAAYANRGYLQKRRGDYKSAIADYRIALQLNPDFSSALNDLAWLQATCPQPEFRDGVSAIKKAKRACELTKYRDWNMLDTLAVAYAEAGRFDQAVKWARAAKKAAPADQRKSLEQRIERFQSKKPHRDKG